MPAQLTGRFTLAGRDAQSRVMFGPHETNLGVRRSFSDRHTAYYERRARGGAGIVVTEVASVHASDWPYERAPLAAECVDGWREVVATCRPHGAMVLAGLGHTGLQGSSAYSQAALWGPSRCADVISRELPMEMEDGEIDALIDGFRSAAAIAVAADVDGVELDAGPRSLLRQFHSGLTNLRLDGYGSDRLRLTREVIAAVRGELGDGRVLSLRLSCDELAPWAGVTPSIAAAQAQELACSLDLLVVVRGGPMTTHRYRPDAHQPAAFNLELCGQIRCAVDGLVPVVLQGSVIDVAAAQRAIADGLADAVEMTRAQIADPDVVMKSRAGTAPRPCILCNQTCLVRDHRNPIVTCVGNPTAGHESVDPGESGSLSGTALVVGGGPGGLEAARILAGRGLQVTVVERAARLGGMVRTAAVASPRLRGLVEWLESECRSLGVKFVLSTTVSTRDVDAAERAGAVVVFATGSRRREIPFAMQGNVQCLTAAEVLDGTELIDGPVVIFDPVGGPVAVALAEWLAGRSVAIVTPDPVVGSRLGPTGDLADANVRLQQRGIQRYTSATIAALDDEGLHLVDRFTGTKSVLACSVLIDCSHRLPEDELSSGWPNVLRVGDAVAPRTILEAVREGRLGADAVTSARPAFVNKR